MEKINGGVTSPIGFSAMGVHAGIKKEDLDMAMVYSDTPCACAGTFTTNKVKAAPVLWDKKAVYDNEFSQVIVCNSGVANACTGSVGMKCCDIMAEETAKCLGVPKEYVLVASTGVIGENLPMKEIVNGIGMLAPTLNKQVEGGNMAARAIMTTDTKPKEAAIKVKVDGVDVTIGGMCKGSGMIHPNMCTMLSFITTDADISKSLLYDALKSNVDDTFNMVTVDGDMSTNDTVLIMANGLAKNKKITKKDDSYKIFKEALGIVTKTLAKKIAADGEGADALLEVKVQGCRTKEDAKILARSVVGSNLVKAMIYGHDSNCGRIMCALGYAGVDFDQEKVDISYESKEGTIKVMENGMMTNYDEERATKILSHANVKVIADMKMGDNEATAYGCDLTHEYVSINADYRT